MMNAESIEAGKKTVSNLVKSSSDYIARLPEDTCSVVEDLKSLQLALNDLQVRCKLECLEVKKKYLDLQRPLLEKWRDLISGKLPSSTQANHEAGLKDEPTESKTALVGIPSFWLTTLKNHLLFHDLIEEHDQDALTHLVDIRLEYLGGLSPTQEPGYKILFEFDPNDYFENTILSKTYQHDRTRIGCSGDFAYISAAGTEIQWKKGMDLIYRVDGSYRGSFFEFFTTLTKEEIEEAAVDDEWREVIKDDIEHDYQLGAALKDEILPHAFDWFTGRLLAEASATVPHADDAEKVISLGSPERGPQYGYKAILRDASTDLANSLISLAAQHGHITALKLLIRRADIDVNFQDAEGRTPIYFAAREGHEAIAKILLAQDRIDVNLSSRARQMTPLYASACQGHGPVVRLLLSHRGIDINARSNKGATPFYIAAQRGHEPVVKLLLGQRGIDINARSNKGATPLYIAAHNGHEAVVKLLLTLDGIDLESGPTGSSPHSYAVSQGHKGVATLLEHALSRKRGHTRR